MIIGLGIDLINVDRLNRVLQKYGNRFTTRVYNLSERRKAENRANVSETYAKRWAAKEAVIKALGMKSNMGFNWRDIRITNKRSGQPTVLLSGKPYTRLCQILPKNHKANISLSITDDRPWAQAMVIIEALPISPNVLFKKATIHNFTRKHVGD